MKKVMAMFLISLFVMVSTGCSKQEKSYTDFTEEDVNGDWNRTEVEQARKATLSISDFEAGTFKYKITANRAAYTGTLEGKAVFTDQETAVEEKTAGDKTKVTITFVFLENSLEVATKNSDKLDIGNVSFDGMYTREQPEYTDEGLMDSILDTDKKKTALKSLLGSDYSIFEEVINGGFSYETELTYSGYMDGANIGCDLWIVDDDTMYCMINDAGKFRFYTTDPEYYKKLPVKFKDYSEETVIFMSREADD